MTRTVAAFDFDGTLSSRDNFLRFVRLVAGTADTARAKELYETMARELKFDPRAASGN